MSRKRITQIFPWLLPLRKRQRLWCFYRRMDRDENIYSVTKSERALPQLLFETSCPLYNLDTGFDMVYQENKAFNLKLAAATIDGLLIRPHEVFSFWYLVRYADWETPYRDGLVVVDGRLVTAPGGGLCQMSNLLFWMFLHTPLTVLERHGHEVKDFPEPPSDAPMGVDATVAEGWLDLRVRNDTENTYQISISFDEERIIGRLYTDSTDGVVYEVKNSKLVYSRCGSAVFEEVNVLQSAVLPSGEHQMPKLMYRNRCRIGYKLPEEVYVVEDVQS